MRHYLLFLTLLSFQNLLEGQSVDSLVAKAKSFEGVQMDSTIHYYFQALEVVTPENKGKLLTIHDGLTTGLRMKGRYPEALNHGYEALRYCRNARDSIYIYSKLGAIQVLTIFIKQIACFNVLNPYSVKKPIVLLIN